MSVPDDQWGPGDNEGKSEEQLSAAAELRRQRRARAKALAAGQVRLAEVCCGCMALLLRVTCVLAAVVVDPE